MAFTGTSNELVKIANLKTDVLSLKDDAITTNVNVDTEALISSLIQEIENLKSIVANVQNPIKVGTIVPFAGEALSETDHSAIMAPDGYEWCFGQIVSKTDEKYSALYSVIGNHWNTSETLTEDQFQLPDLRNCFLRGCPEYIENSEENRLVGNFQACGSPEITGATSYHSWHSVAYGSFYFDETVDNSRRGGTAIDNNSPVAGSRFKASLSSPVYQDGLTEVRPDNKAVNYIIKL